MLCYGLLFVMWCEPPRPVAAVACPQIEAWSSIFELELYNELQKAGPSLRLQYRQHLRMRDQTRKCREAR